MWPLVLANQKFSVDRWGACLSGRAFTQRVQNPGRGPPQPLEGCGGIMNIIAYIFDMYRNYLFTCVKQLCICGIKVFLLRIIPLCLIKGFFFFAFIDPCLSNLQLQSVQKAVISSKSLLRLSSYWNLNN